MRNSKGQFIKGHASSRDIVKGKQIFTWVCENCNTKTTRTLRELRYVVTNRRFCSMDCVYAFGPRKGMVTPPDRKLKLREQKLGSKNPAWRGGVSSVRVKLSNTEEYKLWRSSVFERDDYTCRHCGTRGGYIEADHIIPYMIDKTALLDVNNGQTLCKSCHRIKSTEEMKKNWINQYSSAKDANKGEI